MTTDPYSFDRPVGGSLTIGTQSSGAGKATFDPATMTLPVGDAPMALHDTMTTGVDLSRAIVVLYPPIRPRP